MQRFFFHVRLKSRALVEDWEGRELLDLDSAHKAACADARELILEGIKRGDFADYQAIEISDAEFHLLDVVTVDEILQKLGGEPEQGTRAGCCSARDVTAPKIGTSRIFVR